MEERKQELVIKISNQTIEFHLENGPAENFHTFCHVDDNGIINMKDTDDFIKLLAKILLIVPKEIGNRITKYMLDAMPEDSKIKLLQELVEIHVNSKELKEQTPKTTATKEEEVLKLIAEEDLKTRINQIMGDMEYHELLNKMETSVKEDIETEQLNTVMKKEKEIVKKDNNEKTSFDDMLAMLRKKVQEKDDEIKRLQQENAKLKEALPEGNILEETFNRR